jgi:hypothetical protein
MYTATILDTIFCDVLNNPFHGLALLSIYHVIDYYYKFRVDIFNVSIRFTQFNMERQIMM